MNATILAARFFQRFFPGLVNSKMKNAMLKKAGIDVGEETYFFDAGRITIDCSRPALLSIGSYCKITSGVVVLTHDYSRSVLRRVYGDVVGEARKTKIGNNVFIGMNSIILMGSCIGNNCIVGAGSVCHGTYPDNSVIAGNPAKIICTLDEYYAKRKKESPVEALEYASLFKKKYGKNPSINDMGPFFPLYLERSRESLRLNGIRTALSGDSQDDIIEKFLASKPEYKNFEEFLEKVVEYEKGYNCNSVRISKQG